jgi:hypothetical protein
MSTKGVTLVGTHGWKDDIDHFTLTLRVMVVIEKTRLKNIKTINEK